MAKPAPMRYSLQFPTVKNVPLLLAYAETGKLREACRAAYVDTKLHSYWKRTDPDYAAAYDERQDTPQTGR